MPAIDKQEMENIRNKMRAARGGSPAEESDDDWRTSLFVMAPIDEDEAGITDMEVWDIARTLVNIPGSLARGMGLIGEMALNPIDTATGVARLGLSGLHAGAKAVLSGDLSSNDDTEVFWQFVEEVKKRYGTEIRKSVVEDPLGMVMDVAGIMMGGGSVAARAPGMLGKLGAGTRGAGRSMMKATPPGMLEGGIRGGASLANRVMGKALPEVGGLTSGVSPIALKEGYGQSAKSAEARAAFQGGLRETTPLQALQDDYGKGASKLIKGRSDEFDAKMATVADVPVNSNRLRSNVLAYLEDEWGIRPTKTNDAGYSRASGVKEARTNDDYPNGVIQFEHVDADFKSLDNANISVLGKAFTRLVDVMDEGRNLRRGQRAVDEGSPEVMQAFRANVEELQNVREWWRDHKGASTERYKRSNLAMKKLLDMAGKEIEKASPEAWAAITKYAADSTFIEDLAMVYKEGRGYKETAQTVGKTLQAFRENPSADVKRIYMEALESKAESFFKGPAAGAMMSQWAPTGIHARSIMIGALGGAAFVSPMAILALPLSSPRLVGEMLSLMGAGSRAGRSLGVWMNKLHDLRRKHLPHMVDSVAIGTAVQRLLEQGVDVPPIPEDIKPFKMPAPPKGSRRAPSQMLGGGFAG